MRLKPGDHIGEYRILEVIGNGGFSVIYRAEDTLLLREVAIKQLSTEILVEETTREWFFREARLAASLNHPNIVGTYALREEADSLYLIMEYLPGGDLHLLMDQHGTLDLTTILHVATDVCHALEALHTRNVIHRDIKPENILIGTEGQFKLADFGLAHIRQAHHNDDTGPQPGTLLYMSPEQALGQRITLRSDIYSLAVVLYECMTGHYYLDYEPDDFDDDELTAMIAEAYPIPPETHHVSVPEELADPLMRALSKDPHERPQSAREFLAELRSTVARAKRLKRASKSRRESQGVLVRSGLLRDLYAIRTMRDAEQQPQDAHRRLLPLWEQYRDVPEVMAEWGETLLALDAVEEGRQYLEQAVQRKPALPFAQLALAEIYRDIDADDEEADSALIEAIQADPDLVYAEFYDELYAAVNDPEAFDRYAALFKRAAEDGPTAPIYHNLGQVLSLDPSFEDACLAAFEMAIELDPDYGPAYVGLGSALIALDRPLEAIPVLEQATYQYFPVQPPEDWHRTGIVYQRAHAFLVLAFAYAASAQYENSVVAARNVREMAPALLDDHLPDLLTTYTDAAQGWLSDGKYLRAYRFLSQVLPLAASWGDYRAFLLMGEVQQHINPDYRNRHVWNEALDWLQMSLNNLHQQDPLSHGSTRATT